MPPPPNFSDSPAFKSFVDIVTQEMKQSLASLMQQSVARIEQSVSPAGRVVNVRRRDENNQPRVEQSTTPQLLAELNDNLVDLVDTLAEANDLVRRQLDQVEDVAPRRKRRRRL